MPVYQWRQKTLISLESDHELATGAIEYYRMNPAAFINHWVDTYDPRNAGTSLPARIPLLMFPRQMELVQFLDDMRLNQVGGLIEKARDMGATWVCCAYAFWVWRFLDGGSIGFGSRKEELVDRLGDMGSIFQKLRMLILGIPPLFWPHGFNPDKNMSFMKIINPDTDAAITGEVGDNIGRGGRNLMYFKDESAHYARPELIEASLGDNTNVQIDLSSVNGIGNVFHNRREAGQEWRPGCEVVKERTNVFIMDWRDHPAKTQAWYDSRKSKAVAEGLLAKFAQEVDRDYSASVEGLIIPAEWVTSAVDAHVKLDLKPKGIYTAALDVADGGGDTNALAAKRGIVLASLDMWGERDTGVTTRKAVAMCRDLNCRVLEFDSIGIGAGVKAETNRLRDDDELPERLRLSPWNAGASPLDKDEHLIPDDEESMLNGDFYANLKAQGWWKLRLRFERTHRAVTDPEFTWQEDELISLPSDLPHLHTLKKELSQPTAGLNSKMKLLVNKQPEGTKSPNMGDAVMMLYHPVPPEAATTLEKVKLG